MALRLSSVSVPARDRSMMVHHVLAHLKLLWSVTLLAVLEVCALTNLEKEFCTFSLATSNWPLRVKEYVNLCRTLFGFNL